MPERFTVMSNELIDSLVEARSRTLDLVADLSDEQTMGPRLRIVNPPLWEIGHVAWFQEKWALRHLRGRTSLMNGADALYDSAAVAHDTRWELPLPSRQETLAYMRRVLESVIDALSKGDVSDRDTYFHLLPLYHEDMHTEAITYTRQTLSYAPPRFRAESQKIENKGGALPGDVEVMGGEFQLGATRDFPFVFDNEKWAHAVKVPTFRIARAPVTNVEFLEFVEAGGYAQDQWWSEAGRQWRAESGARHPVYWIRESSGRWQHRRFDRVVPLESSLPVLHINWFEAEAYCNWARRRLPTEAEWEMAASSVPPGQAGEHGVSGRRRLFPWGDEAPTPSRANLDWRSGGCLPVSALPEGDSAFGCRQMIGNVWEWTSDAFQPYPGFAADPYAEYSAPWFGDHKVLRGGCWTTRSRLIRNTWRNFYTPDRRDVWAGFRTCAP